MFRCDHCEATASTPGQEWHWVRLTNSRDGRIVVARDTVACSDKCLEALIERERKAHLAIRFS